MNIKEEQKKLFIFKKKAWTEIKGLEQEYKRNIDRATEIEEKQSDISARVQLILSKIEDKSNKIDCFCYDNKLGEFAE